VIIAFAGLTVEQGIRGLLRRRGNAGAGKDESAKQLVQKHGFVPLAFADPLKRFLADTFDWDEDRLWGPSENRAKEDTRYLRNYGPFADLRYKNEALAVREAGGYLVRVKRWVPRIKVAPTHQSERDLLDIHDDDFDWILQNRSTIEDLWSQVDHMVDNMGK
jgi:hypothetical protein